MIFRWLRNRRRRKLTDAPFPPEWESWLADNVPLLDGLVPADRATLRARIQVLVAEKNWEGCGGLEMTDEIKVTVAAQAALLTLHFDEPFFDHVLSILVYPTAYLAPNSVPAGGEIQIEGGHSHRLGEAWWQGPVILSWQDVLAGGRREDPGANLVLHEFAHQLDMLNGRIVDGTPPVGGPEQLDRWIDAMTPAYERLVRHCHRGRAGFLNCYAATNVGEFFAVATEAFFTDPLHVYHSEPEVYGVLRDFYRQDPAAWEST